MSDCIEWLYNITTKGYGRKSVDGKMYLAHRLAYAKANGFPIVDLEGWVIRHTCDNPPCVNPEHLVIGTDGDNANDRDKRGRQIPFKGSESGMAKLTEAQVLQIREQAGISYAELGRQYGVTDVMIRNIILRKNWTHI